MELSKLMEMIQNAGTSEDDATRRSILSDIQDEVTSMYNANAELTSSNESLTAEVTRLNEANMKLFLKIGEDRTPTDAPESPTEKPKFSDLFNEKGEIK